MFYLSFSVNYFEVGVVFNVIPFCFSMVVCFSGVQLYDNVVDKAQKAFETWRMVPAPKRGDIVRQIGDALRNAKDSLAKLVTLVEIIIIIIFDGVYMCFEAFFL